MLKIGVLIIPNVLEIPLNIHSLLFAIHNRWWIKGTISLEYAKAIKYFKIVYSGGHHRQWCGQGWHFQQLVFHKELPEDHYKSFIANNFHSCDCTGTWL